MSAARIAESLLRPGILVVITLLLCARFDVASSNASALKFVALRRIIVVIDIHWLARSKATYMHAALRSRR